MDGFQFRSRKCLPSLVSRHPLWFCAPDCPLHRMRYERFLCSTKVVARGNYCASSRIGLFLLTGVGSEVAAAACAGEIESSLVCRLRDRPERSGGGGSDRVTLRRVTTGHRERSIPISRAISLRLPKSAAIIFLSPICSGTCGTNSV